VVTQMMTWTRIRRPRPIGAAAPVSSPSGTSACLVGASSGSVSWSSDPDVDAIAVVPFPGWARELRTHPISPLRSGGVWALAELVDDDQAQREHAERPERRVAGSGKRLDRADRPGDDPDDAAEAAAREQRERGDDLDRAHDQGDPAPRVEAADDVDL